jgi:hypothetical protein
MVETEQDWRAEVVRLKREGMESKDIANVVGKSASTVRKVIKRAIDEGHANTNGHREEFTVEAVADALQAPIPGQVDIDGSEARDPLEQFKAEAGEAVGEMQPRPGEEPAGVLDEPVVFVRGTRQLALDFGPNAAPVRDATVTFKSEKMASGFFGLGDVVSGTFTARIVGVPAKEKFDEASGEFRAQPVAHSALITEIEFGAVGGDE